MKMKMFNTILISAFAISCAAQKTTTLPVPSPIQLQWQDAELVAIFHYDLHVFDGERYNQHRNRITPVPDYNIFAPERLDTDQWIRAAKDMGAKIAIITATHETGFALYQSDVNPYSLKALKWQDGKGDIVKDFVASCKKYGILPGIYIGIRWNSFYGIHDFKVQGDTQFSENRQLHYNKMCEGMVEELTSQYGDLAIVWFDGGAHGPDQGGPDVLPIFEKNQPNALFYHNLDRSDIRWGGTESGTVPYPCWGTYGHPSWFSTRGDEEGFRPIKYGDPDGKYYMPAMSDAPLRGYNGRHEWFWEPDDEAHIFPLENLMDMYYRSVGRNSTLIMGLTPDSDGLLPEPDVKRLKEWGDEIKNRFSRPVAETAGTGNRVALALNKPQEIDHIILQEDIAQGERVREFTVQGKIDGKWQELYKGSSIGHKHIIDIRSVMTDNLRLNISKAVGLPQIKGFSAFRIGGNK